MDVALTLRVSVSLLLNGNVPRNWIRMSDVYRSVRVGVSPVSIVYGRRRRRRRKISKHDKFVISFWLLSEQKSWLNGLLLPANGDDDGICGAFHNCTEKPILPHENKTISFEMGCAVANLNSH